MVAYFMLDSTGILVRNTLVTYDREDNKVGFWKTNCSELWKSLSHENAQAPAPASNDWNLSGGISPDIAPGGLPPTDLPPIDLPGRVRN